MKIDSKWHLILLFSALTALVSFRAHAETAAEKNKYELANVIKGLMINNGADDFEYTDLKKYSKGNEYYIDNISDRPTYNGKPYRTEEYSLNYKGKMPLYIRGLRFIRENMEDDNLWNVEISGSHAKPMKFYFFSIKPEINLSGGPKYLKQNGIKLKTIACVIDTPLNYLVFYRASARGKQSIILEVMASSGSGGTWYSYGIHWTDYILNHFPSDVEPGKCPIEE